MDDRELEEQFLDELDTLTRAGAGMPFVFKPGEAWFLLAILQTVLRHPEMPANVATFARGLAQNIETRLCKTPAMREIARRGWIDPPEPSLLHPAQQKKEPEAVERTEFPAEPPRTMSIETPHDDYPRVTDAPPPERPKPRPPLDVKPVRPPIAKKRGK